MTHNALRVGIIAWLLGSWAVPALAQSRSPLDQPVISRCAECDDLQKAVIEQILLVRDLDRARDEAGARLHDARARLSAARSDLELVPRNATAAQRQAAEARVTAFAAAAREAGRLYDLAYSSWLSALDEWAWRHARLSACNERCPKPTSSDAPTNTRSPDAPVNTTGGTQSTPGPPQCPDCAKLLEELNRLDHLIWLWNDLLEDMRERRSKLSTERSNFIERRDVLKAAQQSGLPLPEAEYEQRLSELDTEQGKVDAELESLSDEFDNANDTLKELRAEREQWWPRWDACNKSCNPKRTPWLTRPMFWIPIAGIIGGAKLAGGDSPPVTTNTTPGATPSTSTTPPATTTPPARPSANGRYRCIQVSISSDNGRLNAIINLGPQLTGDFTVTEGSITIRHPAPFIDIVDAQFDTASGRFSGDARGTVVGIPNVGVRAAGTVDSSAGRIEINYTIGTGGELPGGQPITYGLTLQRQ